MLSAMLFGVACQQDIDYVDLTKGTNNGVIVTLGVNVPELEATRSGEEGTVPGLNSGLGAIDNFDAAQKWGEHDLRYMMEIYEVTEGYKNEESPIKNERLVSVHNSYEPTSFKVRLIPNRKYRFVVWADFVQEGSTVENVNDLYYDTTDLNNITRKNVTAMEESYDAYFIQKDFVVEANGLTEPLELKRPFGKVRIITTDFDEVNIGSEPTKVTVKFFNHALSNSLDAVTGVASGESYNEYIEYAIDKNNPYTEGWDSSASNMTLFADYILGGDETKGAQEINIEMTVWGKDGREIITRKFDTQIPLERNKLTTIIGNLLTVGTEFNITIDDNFSGEYVHDVEDEQTAITEWSAGELNEEHNYEFTINDGTNNFSLLVSENAIENGQLKAAKYTFVENDGKSLEDGNFTINNLKVAATRSDLIDAIVKAGTLNVTNREEGGVDVALDLYYATDAEDTEYDNISYTFTSEENIVAKTRIATPEVNADVKSNVITLTWDAIEGAANYSITNGSEMPVFVEEPTYVFTGEYDTEYTFAVVAIAADEAKHYESECATVTAKTKPAPVAIAAPVVTATVDVNVITLTWEAIEGAAHYTVQVDDDVEEVVEATSYTFEGDYEFEYTFTIKAIAAYTEFNLDSEAVVVEVTTEAKPQPEGPVAGDEVTVAKFLDMKNKANEFVLTGKITRVVNTTYGNFDLTDETGTVYVYGLLTPDGAQQKQWAEAGLREGDNITIKGIYSEYNGDPQVKNATYISHVAAPFIEATAVTAEAAETTATLAVSANVAWTVACDATWVISYTTSGSENGSIYVEMEANESEESRAATFTLSGEDVEDVVVKLTQKGKPAAGQVEGGSDDFHTISATNTSYVSGKTTAGWNYKNCAIFKGGTSDSSPAFKMIGDASNRALCMNGKTSAVGSITSPTFSTGCGTLKFNYGLPFSDTKIKFRVDIMQNGAVVKTFTVDKSSATKLTKYSHEETIEVVGDFQIVFTNLSPSNSTSNKDRTAIWDIEWTGYTE